MLTRVISLLKRKNHDNKHSTVFTYHDKLEIEKLNFLFNFEFLDLFYCFMLDGITIYQKKT